MQQRRPPPRACHFIPARAPRRARMRASTLAAAALAARAWTLRRRSGGAPRAARGDLPARPGASFRASGEAARGARDAASPSDAGDAPLPRPPAPSPAAPSPSPRRREARADGGPDADASDDDDGIVAPLADGAEVFFLAAAAGLKTAQWRERSASESPRSVATSVAAAAPVAPPPPTLHQGWLPDAALFFAVAFGAANRRRLPPSRARDASSSRSTPRVDRSTDRFGRRPTVPDRLRNLELNQDRLGAKVDRAARDLSKTRVKLRLTRRAISDERAGERSAEDAAARLAAMERAIAQLAEELAMAQRTMAAMQDVAAKQFETPPARGGTQARNRRSRRGTGGGDDASRDDERRVPGEGADFRGVPREEPAAARANATRAETVVGTGVPGRGGHRRVRGGEERRSRRERPGSDPGRGRGRRRGRNEGRG